ncbi:MAG: flagellar basal-body rod protein FlgF [Myxococcales bacterium]|nr:flagellar basal-body rod protein FlgF [Myxococcales bacterium]
MSTGIYTAMLGARAQEHALESVNNNLANANTPGFKRQASIYRSVHSDAQRLGNSKQAEDIKSPVRFLPDDRVAGVMEERFTQFEQGPLKQTGNDLDFALQGEGFFTLAGKDGPLYTRNGSFTLGADGTLVTLDGNPVLDDSGQTIRIPDTSAKVSVTSAGEVLAGGARIAKLGIVKFEDPQPLQRQGNSEWQVPTAPVVDGLAPPPPTDLGGPVTDVAAFPTLTPTKVDRPAVHQGWLEGSNVNPISTMTLMIKTSRLFELNSKIIQSYKQMDSQSAQEVGRTV